MTTLESNEAAVKSVADEPPPMNGIEGLRKYWWSDLKASLPVTLVAMAVSLVIAKISGFPPIAGLISVIAAGFVTAIVGGSYNTISGPAAGLAPVVLGAVMMLGHGNKENGHTLVTAVICLVAVVQLILAKFRLARYAAIFPVSVEHGMFAAIGLMITVKSVALLSGSSFKSKEFEHMILEVPSLIMRGDHLVMTISAIGLVLMFGLNFIGNKIKWTPMAFVAPIGVALLSLFAAYALKLDAKFRIDLPANIWSGIQTPNFMGLYNDRSLWLPVIGYVVLFTVVDSGESLTTVSAMAKQDKYGRKPDSNVVLMAMAFCNFFSAMLGGLTIIPEGVRSKAYILGGGKTIWGNMFMSITMLVMVLLGTSVIAWFPIAGLTCIVFYVGYQMVKPTVWLHTLHVGKAQFLIFLVTMVVTVVDDLAVGIMTGLAVKLVVIYYFTFTHEGGKKVPKWTLALIFLAAGVTAYATHSLMLGIFGGITLMLLAIFTFMLDKSKNLKAWPLFKSLWKNPIKVTHRKEVGLYEIHVDGPLVCTNMWAQQHIFEDIPKTPGKPLDVIFTTDDENCHMVDDTSRVNLESFKLYYEKAGRGTVDISALEGMVPVTDHPHSIRVPAIRPVPVLPVPAAD